MARDNLIPTIVFVKVQHIISLLIAVPDFKSDIPFTYLFIEASNKWKKLLIEIMNKNKISYSSDSDSDSNSESDS